MGLDPAARLRRVITPLVAVCLACCALFAPGIARAAFPGTNGKIVFSSLSDVNGSIFATEPTPGAPWQRLTSNPADNAQPTWSPDGRRIAFRSKRDGNYEIYVMNAEGTGQTRLTVSPNRQATDPGWSPDGRRLIFRTNRDGDPELFVMNSDGSTLRQLTANSSDERYPAFSPDGSRVLFASNRDGDYEIYTMGATGQDLAQLTRNGSIDTAPAWAPNGDRIVFRSQRDGNSEIYTMAPDGTSQARLTNSPALEGEPDWSPDEQRIVFSTNRDSSSDIYMMAPDGTGQTRLTNAPSRELFPDWQPLGSPVSIPRPPAMDSRAPSLRLRLSRRRPLLRAGSLSVTIRCDERCIVTATARVKGPGGTLARSHTRRTIPGAVTRSLRLRLSHAELRRVRRSLRRGRPLRALVSARARDRAGNSRRVKRTFKLSR